MEEARRQAEEARKAQEEDAPRNRCVTLVPVDSSSFPLPVVNTLNKLTTFCDGGDIDKTLKVLKDPSTYGTIIWEVSGLADIKACIEDPTALGCVMAVAGVLPSGKFKLLTKFDNAVDSLKVGRAARRTVACLTKPEAHSFPAGTKVLMADGTGRPIEQIEPGDLVTATDPTTGETGARRVTRTIHTPDDRNFTDVTLADGSTLTSTSHHPYWSQNDQEWKDASDLEAGDTLRTPQNSTATIARTRDWQGLQDAYDLTVDDLHTYYVSTGTTNVLVHNNDGCPTWVTLALNKLPVGDGIAAEGYVFRADGTPVWTTTVKSGKSSVAEEINEFLRASPDFRDFKSKYLSISGHSEAKAAWAMRNNGTPYETLHIVINKNYVCPKANDVVQEGCQQTVPAILFEDQTLCVWMPGANSAFPLPGKAKREGVQYPRPEGQDPGDACLL